MLSAAAGGAMRLAPVVMEYLSKRSERAHERVMQEIEFRFAKEIGPRGAETTGAPPLAEADVLALRESYIAGAAERAAGRFAWLDGVTGLVRPVVTLWLLTLYVAIRGRNPAGYGTEDVALLSGVVGFWFMGRAIGTGR